MSLGKEQISGRQLMFSIACFVQGSSLVTSYVTTTAKQETWIVIIAGYIVSLPILGMYAALAHIFPGKSIVEITINVFGNILGRIFSLLYIYFFFSLAFLNTRDMGNFINGFIMPKTPMMAFLIMFIFICAWAVRSGVETMTRYSVLFVITSFIVTSTTSILLFKDMKTSNFFPILSLPISKYLQGTHAVIAIPFCEIISFFMLFPDVKETKKVTKALYGGVTIGLVTLLLSTLRNTAVLGPLIPILSSPTFETIRFIDVGHILTKMEILYAGSLIMLLFFKVTIIYYATVKGIAQVFNLHSFRVLVPIFGVLIIISAFSVFDSAVEHAYWGTHVAAIYSILFEVILPIITLLTMAYKKLTSSIV